MAVNRIHFALILVLAHISWGAAYGQTRTRSSRDSAWRLDRVEFKDGRKLSGLIQAERKEEIEFAEIVRPPGKPMYAVVRTLPPSAIKILYRVPQAERAASFARFHRFKNRALIEAGRMDDVELYEDEFEETFCRRYDGEWFTLWSTSDDETTRRCVVRIEQIFRAYRQLLPPRAASDQLNILLFGSMNQYGDYLRGHGLTLKNAAFYSGQRNLIVAASDINSLGKRLGMTRRQNEEAREQLEKLDKEFVQKFLKLSGELKRAGFTTAEIRLEKNARENAWRDEFDRRLHQLDLAGRRNNSFFLKQTKQMFSRLYHEAFHAYLENNVYPRSKCDVPRWFNEGLAQVFEAGQLDAGLLRIDAPHQRLLKRLQEDLSGPAPLRLTQLLNSQQQEFVLSHENASPERHYLYSWGVTYYLTFLHQLDPTAIDAFVSLDQAKSPTTPRFERLVGMRMPEFEARWRKAMMELK